jgi:alkylation response protein AidB-like acyl-CoA dehydrogenase
VNMDVVEVARSLGPLVQAHADDAERNRRQSPEVVSAMAGAGLFRLAAPEVYGGLEADPVTMIRAIEAVSEADGATGWTLMIGIETVGIALAALPPSSAASLLGERPDIVFAGALNPLGRAVEVEGGLLVNGRWPFSSGCQTADYFWGGCLLTDPGGEPHRLNGQRISRQIVVPRAAYEVVETWDASGLRGSGSHDVVIADRFVPNDFVTDVDGTGMRVDTPLFRLPVRSRLAFNKVGVATGIARTALAAFERLANEKTPFREIELLRERPQAQLAMAEAEARLGAARAYVFEVVGEMWTAICARRPVTLRDQARVRLACSHCCAEAVHAVDLVATQAGITASFPSSPLERAVRDVRVVPQHAMVAPGAIVAAGRVLLGLDPGNRLF